MTFKVVRKRDAEKAATAGTVNGLQNERSQRLKQNTTRTSNIEQEAAHRALKEMLANGAHFRVTRRDGIKSLVYELPQGGDRARCRAIIKDAKDRGGVFWNSFVDAICAYSGCA